MSIEPNDVLDVEGWPLRAGQRVRVAGVSAVPGGAMTTSRTGEVVSIFTQLVPGKPPRPVVQFLDDSTGGVYAAPPERVKVRKQSKAEREAMLAELRKPKRPKR